MKANFISKLLRYVRKPLVLQVSHSLSLYPNKLLSTDIDSKTWSPDFHGGDTWCIQSFCLNHPLWLADFRNSFYILYCSDLIISDDLLLSNGVEFRNLYRDIAFAKGTPFDWGLYFAKYFGCSLIIHMKSPQRSINMNIRPEDTLDRVLYKWSFNSVSEPLNLTKLNPSLLYMSD